MTNKPIHLFLLPSLNKNNTYIELLKNGLASVDSSIVLHELPQDDLWGIWKILTSYDHKSVINVLHVQWPTVLYGSRFALKSLYLIFRNKIILSILKLCYGFKIVWTVHNFYAHDYSHRIIDRLGTHMIRFFADKIIVQQETTLASWRTMYPRKSITYIPHGNYIDVYGPLKSSDDNLRKSFGFSKDDIVLISLGVIAPYKRNDKIIEAFLLAKKGNQKLRLLIAGKGNKEHVVFLRSLAASDSSIVISDSFVPNEKIPEYLACADYSVFYYDESEMTSGGLMLSLSYGIPAIIRNIPASEIIDLAHGTNGYVFKSDEQLIAILETLHASSNPNVIRDSIETVKKFDWKGIGEQLIGVYRKD